MFAISFTDLAATALLLGGFAWVVVRLVRMKLGSGSSPRPMGRSGAPGFLWGAGSASRNAGLFGGLSGAGMGSYGGMQSSGGFGSNERTTTDMIVESYAGTAPEDLFGYYRDQSSLMD